MSLPALPPTHADRLRRRPCRGTFEIHLTVRAEGPERREAFRRLCAELGVKCVLIELAQGETPSQPMTASYHRGELPDVLEQLEALHARLTGGGFPVVRVKVEAVASNDGVPISESDANDWPDAYFEFHAQLRLPLGADLEPLRQLCAQHDAHLSRNDLKRDDAAAERFVTLRVYRSGRTTATARFEALLGDLRTAEYAVVNQQREFTIYDGRADLDAGWIDPPREAAP